MTKISITKSENYVEVQVDTITYLLTKEQYDELWHAMRQEDNYASDVLWTSVVTSEYLDPESSERAIDELNDLVADTCMQYAPEEV